MQRFPTKYTEVSFNPKTGRSVVVDAKGLKGVSYISYVALEASRDGKTMYDDGTESLDRDAVQDYANKRAALLPNDRVILLYQSQNYKFPRKQLESDMNLIGILPEMDKWEKIALGYWTDKNVE